MQRRAAEWLALRRARPLSASEQADLAAWCAADPRHEQMLREVETAAQIFDRLAFYPRDPDGPVDPDLLVGRCRLTPAPALLAMAAAAAVAALLWLKTPLPAPAAPAAVALAGPHSLRLPDGTRVELNVDSMVAEHFTAAERRVRLVRGEAHFEVAKNPLRPFIVEADKVSVRAVGTAFDVRLRATTVAVLVTEGKVGVTTAGESTWAAPESDPHRDGNTPAGLGPGLILVAGERTEVHLAQAAGVSRPAIVKTLTRPQIDLALAWQTSRLEFDDLPLAEVVERINRSAAEKNGAATAHLSIASPDLAALRFSGRIRSDRIESFVDVLEKDFGVTVERRGVEIILRSDR